MSTRLAGCAVSKLTETTQRSEHRQLPYPLYPDGRTAPSSVSLVKTQEIINIFTSQ